MKKPRHRTRPQERQDPRIRHLGGMAFAESKFTQDFRNAASDGGIKGEYFYETERSIVILMPHESIDDLVNTCVHETIHHALAASPGDVETPPLDIESEHQAIRFMQWAGEMFHDSSADGFGTPPPHHRR